MERIVIALLIAAFVALLFSRIHFHFSFNLTVSRKAETERSRKGGGRTPQQRGRLDTNANRATIREKAAGTSVPAVAIRPSQDEADLASALLNLGCEKKKALDVARSAMFHGQDFDTRFRWAMQNAA